MFAYTMDALAHNAEEAKREEQLRSRNSVFKISSLAITNLQRKFDKLLFFYLFIWVGNFSYVPLSANKDILVKQI